MEKRLTLVAKEIDEEQDLLLALHARDLLLVITSFREELRRMVKYQDRETIPVEEVRDLFWKMLEDCEVTHLLDR